MAEKEECTRSETIRLWISAAAIPAVVAALGAWQFLLKEVYWPAARPVNLTTEVAVRPAGSEVSTHQAQLRAVELSVTATNVSTRNLYFLSNYWVAYGFNVGEREENDQQVKDWLIAVNKANDEKQEFYHYVGRHFKPTYVRMVAWSNIFPSDYFLCPNEKVSRSFVFYVPEGSYDVLDIAICIPSTSVKNAAEVDYEVSEGGIQQKYYMIGKNGERSEETSEAEFSSKASDVGLQETYAWRQVSLWPLQTSKKGRG